MTKFERRVVFKNDLPNEIRYYEDELLVARLGVKLGKDDEFIGLEDLPIEEVAPSSWLEKLRKRKVQPKKIDVTTIDFIGLIALIDRIRAIDEINQINEITHISTIDQIGIGVQCSSQKGDRISVTANVGYEVASATSGTYWAITHAGYHAKVDGYHCFYVGNSSTLATQRFLALNGTGLIRQTFLNPIALQTSLKKLWFYSSVAEPDLAYDFGHVEVAII